MNNIESNNLSQFINFQNNYPIYSEFPFTIDNEISSNQEQPGIAFDNKLLLNHTFTEDISIINRNIEQKHDIDEKENLNEALPFMNIYSPKYNINNKEKNDKPFKIVKINIFEFKISIILFALFKDIILSIFFLFESGEREKYLVDIFVDKISFIFELNHLRFSSFFIFLDILGLIFLSQFTLFFVFRLFFLTNLSYSIFIYNLNFS